MNKFDFPSTTREEQIEILMRKGLIIKDTEDARKFLDYVPYGKILSYMTPYRHLMDKQRNGEKIEDPITREKIKSTYIFDHKMRILFFEYLSFIELWIKVMFVNVSCDKYGSVTWRTKEENFSKRSLPTILKQYRDALTYYWEQYDIALVEYEKEATEENTIESEETKDSNIKNKIINNIQKQLNNDNTIEKEDNTIEKEDNTIEKEDNTIEKEDNTIKKEDFLKTTIKILDKEGISRYIEKYNDPLYPPIRNIIEELTFGDIAYLINSVTSSVKKGILQKIDISKDGLESCLKWLVDLRNICCHHWKLYTHTFLLHNDLLKKFIQSPSNESIQSPSNESIQDTIKKHHSFFITYSFICYVLEKVDLNLNEAFKTRVTWELKNKKKLYLLEKSD